VVFDFDRHPIRETDLRSEFRIIATCLGIAQTARPKRDSFVAVMHASGLRNR